MARVWVPTELVPAVHRQRPNEERFVLGSVVRQLVVPSKHSPNNPGHGRRRSHGVSHLADVVTELVEGEEDELDVEVDVPKKSEAGLFPMTPRGEVQETVVVRVARALVLPANPDSENELEDGSLLTHYNEAALGHLLGHRHTQGKLYTAVGNTVFAVNAHTGTPQASFGREDMAPYVDWRNRVVQGEPAPPPHPFQVAEDAYRAVLWTKSNQAVVLLGESGSGKTSTLRSVLDYLCHAHVQPGSSAEKSSDSLWLKLSHGLALLENLCHASCVDNKDATCCVYRVQVKYNSEASLCGVQVHVGAFDRTRLVGAVGENECNFHVFHRLVAHCASDAGWRESLGLDQAHCAKGYFALLLDEEITGHEGLGPLLEALDGLGVSALAMGSFFKIVLAVLFLGNVQFADSHGHATVQDTGPLERASALLGVQMGALRDILVASTLQVGRDVVRKPLSQASAMQQRDALITDLYVSCINWAAGLCSGVIAEAGECQSVVSVVDFPGASSSSLQPSVHRLLRNYANDVLAQQFVTNAFENVMNRLKEEGVEHKSCVFEDYRIQVALFRSRGSLCATLEEQGRTRAEPSTAIERLRDSFENHTLFQFSRQFPLQFSLHHAWGWTTYPISSEMLTDNIVAPHSGAATLLSQSKDKFVSSVLSGLVAGLPGGRSEHARRPSAFPTLTNKLRAELDRELGQLDSTQCHYICCLRSNTEQRANHFDSACVMRQLTGPPQAPVVAHVAKHITNRFPHRLSHVEFVQRYAALLTHAPSPDTHQDCEDVLVMGLWVARLGGERQAARADKAEFRNGNQSVFLNHDALATLRAARGGMTAQMVVLQACIRRLDAAKETGRHQAHKQALALKKPAVVIQTLARTIGAQRQCQYIRNLYRQVVVCQSAVRVVLARKRARDVFYAKQQHAGFGDDALAGYSELDTRPAHEPDVGKEEEPEQEQEQEFAEPNASAVVRADERKAAAQQPNGVAVGPESVAQQSPVPPRTSVEESSVYSSHEEGVLDEPEPVQEPEPEQEQESKPEQGSKEEQGQGQEIPGEQGMEGEEEKAEESPKGEHVQVGDHRGDARSEERANNDGAAQVGVVPPAPVPAAAGEGEGGGGQGAVSHEDAGNQGPPSGRESAAKPKHRVPRLDLHSKGSHRAHVHKESISSVQVALGSNSDDEDNHAPAQSAVARERSSSHLQARQLLAQKAKKGKQSAVRPELPQQGSVYNAQGMESPSRYTPHSSVVGARAALMSSQSFAGSTHPSASQGDPSREFHKQQSAPVFQHPRLAQHQAPSPRAASPGPVMSGFQPHSTRPRVPQPSVSPVPMHSYQPPPDQFAQHQQQWQQQGQFQHQFQPQYHQQHEYQQPPQSQQHQFQPPQPQQYQFQPPQFEFQQHEYQQQQHAYGHQQFQQGGVQQPQHQHTPRLVSQHTLPALGFSPQHPQQQQAFESPMRASPQPHRAASPSPFAAPTNQAKLGRFATQPVLQSAVASPRRVGSPVGEGNAAGGNSKLMAMHQAGSSFMTQRSVTPFASGSGQVILLSRLMQDSGVLEPSFVATWQQGLPLDKHTEPMSNALWTVVTQLLLELVKPGDADPNNPDSFVQHTVNCANKQDIESQATFLGRGKGLERVSFRAYAPEAFALLRSVVNMGPDRLRASLSGPPTPVDPPPSPSPANSFAALGSRALVSHDNRLLLRVVSEANSKALRNVLHQYIGQTLDNPNARRPRVLGLYRVRVENAKWYVVVAHNRLRFELALSPGFWGKKKDRSEQSLAHELNQVVYRTALGTPRDIERLANVAQREASPPTTPSPTRQLVQQSSLAHVRSTSPIPRSTSPPPSSLPPLQGRQYATGEPRGAVWGRWVQEYNRLSSNPPHVPTTAKVSKLEGIALPCKMDHTVTVLGHNAYVVGGVDEHGHVTRAVGKFDVSSKGVSYVTLPDASNCPVALIGHSACALAGRFVVVFGGGSGRHPHNRLLVFDTQTLGWHTPHVSGKVPRARVGHTAVACTLPGLEEGHTVMAVFGGVVEDGEGKLACSNEMLVAVLSNDGRSVRWQAPHMTLVRGDAPRPRTAHIAWMTGSTMYVSGGCEGGDAIADLYAFVLDTPNQVFVCPLGQSLARSNHPLCRVSKGQEQWFLTLGGIDTDPRSDCHVAGANPALVPLTLRGDAVSNICNHAMFVCGKWVFVYGGMVAGRVTNSVLSLRFARA